MIFLFFWGGDTKSQFFNFEGGTVKKNVGKTTEKLKIDSFLFI